MSSIAGSGLRIRSSCIAVVVTKPVVTICGVNILVVNVIVPVVTIEEPTTTGGSIGVIDILVSQVVLTVMVHDSVASGIVGVVVVVKSAILIIAGKAGTSIVVCVSIGTYEAVVANVATITIVARDAMNSRRIGVLVIHGVAVLVVVEVALTSGIRVAILVLVPVIVVTVVREEAHVCGLI